MNTKRYILSLLLLITVGLSSVYAQWTQTFQTSSKVTTFAVRGSSLFAGATPGLFYTKDNGGKWDSVSSLARYWVFSMGVNDTDLFAGTANGAGLFRSSNNDTIWTPIGNLRFQAICRGLLVSHVGIEGTTLFLGLYTGGIYGGETLYRSTDNGAHWTYSADGLYYEPQVPRDVEHIAVDGSNLLASMSGLGIYRSIDNGWTWSYVGYGLTGLMDLGVTGLVVRGGYVFVGTGGGIYRSTDHGTSWNTVNSGLTIKNVLSMTASDSGLFAGTAGGGVFLSKNNGESWVRINSGMPSDDVTALTVGPVATAGRFLFAGTRTNGIWKRSLSEIVTSAGRETGYASKQYAVGQNFPNPFNPSTTIRYELTKGSTVSLKIFNALGQLIATLVDAHKEAGYYQAQWSASNVPSGIYFYRLQTGGFLETKKMILLR